MFIQQYFTKDCYVCLFNSISLKIAMYVYLTVFHYEIAMYVYLTVFHYKIAMYVYLTVFH
jgi:hypothetical protein